MQELPELENSELKDLIESIAISIYNYFKGGGQKGSSFILCPSRIHISKLKEARFALNKKFIVCKIPPGEKINHIKESVESFLQSKQEEFGGVIEKLFEDTCGNETIDVGMLYYSDMLRYKITFVGDIETAKIIKYIKDRVP